MSQSLARITAPPGSRLPTRFGSGRLHLFRDDSGAEHSAFVVGEVAGALSLPVRVHSRCLTGDVFGSTRCDCGAQLAWSMRYVAREKRGVVIYLDQEGRGIGLADKLRAYDLQDEEGVDTLDANLRLGRGADERRYDVAASILRELGVRSVCLLTNNPDKLRALTEAGIVVASRVPMPVAVTAENRRYLETKARRMGHFVEAAPRRARAR